MTDDGAINEFFFSCDTPALVERVVLPEEGKRRPNTLVSRALKDTAEGGEYSQCPACGGLRKRRYRMLDGERVQNGFQCWTCIQRRQALIPRREAQNG
jgi:hypothetical protein